MTTWLDVLSAAAPKAYRVAVEAEAQARTERSVLAKRISDLEARLSDAVERDLPGRRIARLGGELTGVRAAFDRLPAVPVVADIEHARAAQGASMLWESTPMPTPPMIASEQVHWRYRHNMGGPEILASERGLVDAYEALSDRAGAAVNAARDLRGDLHKLTVGEQLERWSTIWDELDGVNDAVREMTDRITVADTERRESGAQHRCHSFEGATPLPLRAPAVGWPWRLEYQPDPGLTDTAEGRAAWLNRPRPGFNPRPEPGSMWATIGAGR
ncbi:MAG TPA: hypothetical protein VGL39_23295 [Jatrophihabitantaceae bacterium]|jgi:hypothetical protein